MALASLFALAGLFTAASAMGGQTHPFQSEFTGSATPAGSFSTADRVAIRQSTGNVTVIDKGYGVVDTFDASGSYLSQLGPFSFSSEPDIAIDNSATASEGNLYVMPEFQPLSAYDSSGTLLYQLDGSTTPDGPFGDACGTAVDSSGNIYIGDYGHQKIYKFTSAGTYFETLNVGFTVATSPLLPTARSMRSSTSRRSTSWPRTGPTWASSTTRLPGGSASTSPPTTCSSSTTRRSSSTMPPGAS